MTATDQLKQRHKISSSMHNFLLSTYTPSFRVARLTRPLSGFPLTCLVLTLFEMVLSNPRGSLRFSCSFLQVPLHCYEPRVRIWSHERICGNYFPLCRPFVFLSLLRPLKEASRLPHSGISQFIPYISEYSFTLRSYSSKNVSTSPTAANFSSSGNR